MTLKQFVYTMFSIKDLTDMKINLDLIDIIDKHQREYMSNKTWRAQDGGIVPPVLTESPRKSDDVYANHEYYAEADGTRTYLGELNKETVNSPLHYNHGKIEVKVFLEDQGFAEDFYIGNAIKYLCRAGKKPGVTAYEDFSKAQWYVNELVKLQKKKDV